MTQDELEKLDQDLTREQEEIEEQLKSVSVQNPAVKGDREPLIPDYGPTEDDYAHEVADLDRNFALEHQLEERLEEIKTTRQKIKEGTFGKCENCKQDISVRRLKVMPIAKLCMQCANPK